MDASGPACGRPPRRRINCTWKSTILQEPAAFRPSLEARARLARGTDARRGILAAIRFPGRRTPVPCLRLEQ